MKKMLCMISAFLLCLSACSTVSPAISGSESTDGTDNSTTVSTTATTTTQSPTTTSPETTTTTTSPKTTSSPYRLPCSTVYKEYKPNYVKHCSVEEYRDVFLQIHRYGDFRKWCETKDNVIAKPASLSMLLKDKCFPIPVIKDADMPQINSVSFLVSQATALFNVYDYESLNGQKMLTTHARIKINFSEHPLKTPDESDNGCAIHSSHNSNNQYEISSFVTDTGLHVTKCVTLPPNSDRYGPITYGFAFQDKYRIEVEPRGWDRGDSKEMFQFIENLLDHLTIETVEIQ